jgi:hypothetical protein
MNRKVRFAVMLLAGLLLALLITIAARAAIPARTQTCAAAKTGDPAPACTSVVVCAVPTQATDQVRTVVAGVQRWEPYATLTTSSPVVSCASGGWTNFSALSIPLFSSLIPIPPPPVVVPPVKPAPVPADYTVSVLNTTPATGAVFKGLDSTVEQCFAVTSGGKSAQVCL